MSPVTGKLLDFYDLDKKKLGEGSSAQRSAECWVGGFKEQGCGGALTWEYPNSWMVYLVYLMEFPKLNISWMI